MEKSQKGNNSAQSFYSQYPLVLTQNEKKNRSSLRLSSENDLQVITISAFHRSNELPSLILRKTDCHDQIMEKMEENQQQEGLKEMISSFIESKFFLIFHIFLLIILMVTVIAYGSTTDKNGKKVLMIIEEVCQGLFLARLILKIVGAEKSSIFWVLLDFLTIISSFVGYNIDYNVGRYFLAFRALKFMFLIRQVSFLNEEIGIFMNSFKKASSILAPAVCLIYVYTIVGLYSFHDLQYNRCRHPDNLDKKANWTVYQDEVFLCGERSCPVVNGIQYKCLNPINYGVEPNPDELMTIEQGYGLMNYAHIGTALFSTFKQTLLTGCSRLIILFRQAMSDAYVLFYFYSFIYSMQKQFIISSYIYLNIFYGVIITGLEDSKKKSIREIKSCPRYSIDFGNEDIANFRHSRPKISILRNVQYFQNTQNEDSSNKDPPNETNNVVQVLTKQTIVSKVFTILKILNIIITFITVINLSLDFEGQSSNFRFIVDCIDFALFLLILILVIIQVVLEHKREGKLKKTTIMDIIIMSICFAGVIYEGAVASSFTEFLSAETAAAKVLRTFKYLRVMLIIFDKDIWPEGHKLIVCIYEAVLELRKIILIWFIVMLMLTMIGFHLHTGNTLVNEKGELDLDKGKSRQISFATPYHALIFTILAVYDEEWDYLMFQEYVGSGMIIVVWMLFTMVVGYIIFSRYLTCLLSEKLENAIDSYEETQIDLEKDDEEQLESSVDDGETQMIYNKVAPSRMDADDDNTADQDPIESKCYRCKRFLMMAFDSKPFRFIKVGFILIVAYTLYLDLPNKELTEQEKSLNFGLNVLTFTFFLVETVVNIAFYGLVRDKYSYLRRNYLNILNLVILVIELLYLTPLSSFYIVHRISKVKALRALFIIELRYRSEWEMRILMRSMKKLVVKFFQLLLITFIIYFYFALILTKVYQEDGYYCDNAHQGATIKTKQDCFNWGGDWVKHQINFSHVFSSLLSLCFFGAMEGWLYYMQDMMNFNGGGNPPSYNANEHIQIFFVIFFFFGNIIILNSFISLTLVTFKRLKEKETGEKYLNDTEKMWLRLKLQIIELNPLKREEPPTNCIRALFYKICTHKGYTIFKAVIFALYLVLMSINHSNMPETWKTEIFRLQRIFLICTLAEYFMELIAFCCRVNSRKDFIFDTIVFIFVYVFITIQNSLAVWSPGTLFDRAYGGLLIIFLVLRYLKLLDEIPFAKKVFKTIFSILPKTVNLLFLIVITLFIYSILGIELFSFLRHNTEIDSFNQNYEGFSTAIFALIKFSTTENPIDQITNAAQTLQPNFICHEIIHYEDFLKYGQNGCGSPAASYIFFLSFHLFYSMLLMSTFIAIIVDAYGDIKKEENSEITVDVLERVVKEWVDFDPQATGYISYEDFWKFSGKVVKIYSEKDTKERINLGTKKEFLQKLNIKVYENTGDYYFAFHDVIENLTRLYLEKKLNYQIKEKKIHRKYGNLQIGNIGYVEMPEYSSKDIPTLLLLEAGLKKWKRKSALVEFESDEVGDKIPTLKTIERK